MADPYIARPKDTTFTFFDHVFNVSLLERLLADGVIRAEESDMPVSSVSAMARLESYVFEQDDEGQWTMTQVEDGGTVKVDLDHTLSISPDRKAEPVLVIHLPTQNADEGPTAVLIDGLHRTARHIIDGDSTMRSKVISRPEDICRFHYRKEGSRALDLFGKVVDADKIQVRYVWAGQ